MPGFRNFVIGFAFPFVRMSYFDRLNLFRRRYVLKNGL